MKFPGPKWKKRSPLKRNQIWKLPTSRGFHCSVGFALPAACTGFMQRLHLATNWQASLVSTWKVRWHSGFIYLFLFVFWHKLSYMLSFFAMHACLISTILTDNTRCNLLGPLLQLLLDVWAAEPGETLPRANVPTDTLVLNEKISFVPWTLRWVGSSQQGPLSVVSVKMYVFFFNRGVI